MQTTAPPASPAATPSPPKRNLYFINEVVEEALRLYIWTGCTRVKLRDKIMEHATELIRQIIRKQGLHTIYPGQEESSFNDLLQTAWVQIERTLYKFRARPHCRICYNPDRPADSLLYNPGELEYGIITYEELFKKGITHCRRCQTKLAAEPLVMAEQDLYGGSATVLYRGPSKVFNMWCVSPSTLIPTCHGPLPASTVLEHFEAGLPIHVQGLDGLRAVEAMKTRTMTDTLVISTMLGMRLECSPEHRIYAICDGVIGWPEASKLKRGDLVAVQYDQGLFGDNGSLTDVVLNRRGDWLPPASVTDELANIIGLFIAEGSYSYGKLAIYNVDDDVVKRLVNNNLGLNFIYEPAFQRVSLCNARFIEFLQQLGFPEHTSAATKYIPDRLLCWPRSAIKAMLSGMFDGDGHSSRHNGTVGYTTTSPVLQSQLRMLLLNFGMLSKLSHDNRVGRNFPGSDSRLSGSWQVTLSATASRRFYNDIGFGIGRKQAKAAALPVAREMLYGLNDKFRLLYSRYGVAGGAYDRLRRLLKASACTVDVAKYALAAWHDHRDDPNYQFVANRVAEYEASSDRLVWLPIKDIGHSRSELIDMAVDAPTHSYVANGIVVHNSQIARTVILAHIKKEGRDRKNSGTYRTHIDSRPKPMSDVMLRFLAEAREICKYNDDHLKVLDALERLLRTDEKPYEGVIGKLVEASGLSRAAVTSFMKMIRLRSFEFTDSPVNRSQEVSRRRYRSNGDNHDDD